MPLPFRIVADLAAQARWFYSILTGTPHGNARYSGVSALVNLSASNRSAAIDAWSSRSRKENGSLGQEFGMRDADRQYRPAFSCTSLTADAGYTRTRGISPGVGGGLAGATVPDIVAPNKLSMSPRSKGPVRFH
jgi:hypothetical protein